MRLLVASSAKSTVLSGAVVAALTCSGLWELLRNVMCKKDWELSTCGCLHTSGENVEILCAAANAKQYRFRVFYRRKPRSFPFTILLLLEGRECEALRQGSRLTNALTYS